MYLRRLGAALSASFTLMAAPAAAQSIAPGHVGPVDPSRTTIMTPRSHAPSFHVPQGDLRQAGQPQRNGLIAAVPVNRNLQIGIGRFRVAEIAQPRTHTESDRAPAAIGPRQRSIAGLGFSLRFD